MHFLCEMFVSFTFFHYFCNRYVALWSYIFSYDQLTSTLCSYNINNK